MTRPHLRSWGPGQDMEAPTDSIVGGPPPIWRGASPQAASAWPRGAVSVHSAWRLGSWRVIDPRSDAVTGPPGAGFRNPGVGAGGLLWLCSVARLASPTLPWFGFDACLPSWGIPGRPILDPPSLCACVVVEACEVACRSNSKLETTTARPERKSDDSMPRA